MFVLCSYSIVLLSIPGWYFSLSCFHFFILILILGTEMNPDHPLYNTCKGKAICNKENERTQNCEFLGHESTSGQHDARIHYMLNQSVCDNRPTSDSKDIDYCTSRTQKGSPYVILSDSTLSYRDAQSACRSQGMDLATLTSNEERKELTRTIYQKLHDEKTTYVSCYGHISYIIHILFCCCQLRNI